MTEEDVTNFFFCIGAKIIFVTFPKECHELQSETIGVKQYSRKYTVERHMDIEKYRKVQCIIIETHLHN